MSDDDFDCLIDDLTSLCNDIEFHKDTIERALRLRIDMASRSDETAKHFKSTLPETVSSARRAMFHLQIELKALFFEYRLDLLTNSIPPGLIKRIEEASKPK